MHSNLTHLHFQLELVLWMHLFTTLGFQLRAHLVTRKNK